MRGLSLLLAALLIMVALGWSGAAITLWGFYFTQGIYFILIAGLIMDGYFLARKCRDYELKNYNRWYIYFVLFFIIILGMNVLITLRPLVFGFDNHRNISRNMEPTIRDNELIVSDTRGYLTGFRLQRKHIITFRFPGDPSLTYVKRIIGLPGEYVEIKSGIVYINEKPIPEPYVLKKANQQPYSQFMKKIKVPSNALFVLGDNRDNSNDSRFWGFVPLPNVEGIITGIWYSQDINRIRFGFIK